MITLHHEDIPADLDFGTSVAVDTETTGLSLQRDRLCLIQLSSGDGDAHLVKFSARPNAAPNLCRILGDDTIHKVFHYGRFDMAMIQSHFGIKCQNVFCTKIASKLARTYTEKHSLKDLTKELLQIELDKSSQLSDWAAETLTNTQMEYAASDVLYLHQLKEKLTALLVREKRLEEAEACFRFLPTRVSLDLLGWEETDIFSHH
jgi:ribonuclease D